MSGRESVLAQLERFKKESAKKDFDVEITETLQMTVSVRAASADEAEAIVEANWKNSEYILDADSFVGVEFSAKEPERGRAMKPPGAELG
jgi:hypothetical protein